MRPKLSHLVPVAALTLGCGAATDDPVVETTVVPVPTEDPPAGETTVVPRPVEPPRTGVEATISGMAVDMADERLIVDAGVCATNGYQTNCDQTDEAGKYNLPRMPGFSSADFIYGAEGYPLVSVNVQLHDGIASHTAVMPSSGLAPTRAKLTRRVQSPPVCTRPTRSTICM